MGFTEYLHQLPSTFTRYTGLAKADVHHIEMESERKQPSISFFLEGEEKGFSKSSNGQIRNLMYETVKMVGFFFFFFLLFCSTSTFKNKNKVYYNISSRKTPGEGLDTFLCCRSSNNMH